MTHQSVQEYYGEVLQSSADLQTNACCTPADMPDWLKPVLGKIHDEVASKYFGCGLIAPEALEGARILDLGSGSGRDVYALSALVGESGHVVGVDMTDAQLEVARAHQDYHAQAFGYAKPNTEFHKGYIEKLDELPLEKGSFDIIVSNCVLNLATDKEAVLRGVYDLLKPGGEMYFSDVYADRRMPQDSVDDEVLYGECLSGALYWKDFMVIAARVGFGDVRMAEHRPLTIENPKLEAKVSPIRFASAIYRLFKLPELDAGCEDYGQAVIYKGTIPHHPKAFALDEGHVIETGKVFPVCGNTKAMLQETRFAPHFEILGAGDVHYGAWPNCGSPDPFQGDPAATQSSAAACGC
jgi:arsenite methyltransferase